MADHYDTAYMEDTFGYAHGGHGPRLSAAGADDNHSATAALMLGAEVVLGTQPSRQAWLRRVAGASDGRRVSVRLHGRAASLPAGRAENAADAARATARSHDLSHTRVQGVYVLDMVAHNNDHDRDVFQICPGEQPRIDVAGLSGPPRDRSLERLGRRIGTTGRSARAEAVAGAAPTARCPRSPSIRCSTGEVRPQYDPHSTLFNTDGQIFSDAGVPVVLFMENYDINRKGYHDTHDTLENIDLDYGAAVSAIAIESVARAATEKPPEN